MSATAPGTVGVDTTACLVRVEKVSKTFATANGAVKALDDVSLTLQANEFFTLLGPSGCGKTTLLRLIAGFDHPESGAIFLDGRAVMNDPPNKRPINIVFQSYALFPHLSVRQNVAFGLERQRLPAKVIAARVAAMLHLVQLDDVGDRKPAQLSGGQQQRVALARALAPNPKLLLLDEPLSALDRKLRRGMQIELKRLQRETGITFVLVTHDQEEALSMSDRIGVMDAGRIRQIGTPREVYARPRIRFVADFMGANVLPGTVVGMPAPWVAIRPENVEMATEGAGHPARVQEATYHGAATSYLVALDDGPLIKVEAAGHARLDGGDRVVCRFPVTSLAPLED